MLAGCVLHARLLADLPMFALTSGMHERGVWRMRLTSSLDSEKRWRICEVVVDGLIEAVVVGLHHVVDQLLHPLPLSAQLCHATQHNINTACVPMPSCVLPCVE